MVSRTIVRKGKKYHFYDKYNSYREAKEDALYFKKRNGSKYLIVQVEDGLWFPRIKYILYLSKYMRLSWF